jgi:hypothetical protein
MAPDHAEPADDATPSAPVSAELSDEDWLAAIPLRARIRDKRHFDEEAILWRRLRPDLLRIRERLGASPQEVRDSAYLKPDRYRLRVRLGYAIHLRPPHEWELCAECVDQTDRLPCPRCHGRGFFIEHEGKVQDEAGGVEDRSARATP